MLNLAMRHVKVYFRDPWAVFFSFLSTVIILVLFVVFLNENQQSALPEGLRGTNEGNYLVYSWILSGVLLVGMVTTPLGVLGMMVNDLETKAIHDFYVAPLKRRVVVFSYLFAALFVTMLFGLVNLTVGLGILYFVSGYLVPFVSLVQVLLLMVVSAFLFSGLFYYLVSFIKTNSAHGAMSTLTGTLIGFFAGIYVPVGVFGRGLNTFLGSLPFLQGAALMRNIYMNDAIQVIFGNATEQADQYRRIFGLQIVWGNVGFSNTTVWLLLGAWTVVFVSLSLVKITKFKL